MLANPLSPLVGAYLAGLRRWAIVCVTLTLMFFAVPLAPALPQPQAEAYGPGLCAGTW